MEVPILRITNEEESQITLLIEPHLEFYEILSDESVDVYYSYLPDNTTQDIRYHDQKKKPLCNYSVGKSVSLVSFGR